VLQPSDADIYTILDGYADTFWMLDTTIDNTHVIQIQFPTSIKPYVNYLTLRAFPAFSIKLNSVIVTKADGTTQDVLEGNVVAQEAGILTVHFKPVSWGGVVTINLTAMGSVIGLSDIDIGLIDYVDSQARIIFEVPALTGVAFSTGISEVDLMDCGLFGYGIQDSGYIKTKEIIVKAYVGDLSTPIDISENTLNGIGTTTCSKAAGDRFYLEFRFKTYQGQSPMFRSAKLTYIL
jgi:hypothetical protein